MGIRCRLKDEPAGLDPVGRMSTAPADAPQTVAVLSSALGASLVPDLLILTTPYKMGSLIIPELQMSQLRHWGVKITFPKLLYK